MEYFEGFAKPNAEQNLDSLFVRIKSGTIYIYVDKCM